MSNLPTVAERRPTYADLRAVPDHLVAELLCGELVTTPRPRLRHSMAALRVGRFVGGRFEDGIGGPGGWWFLSEPELHLGEDVVVPDLAGWLRERMPEIPDAAFCEVAPDWVCEVLSASTEAVDRGLKLGIYGRAGVKHVWLLNPTSRMLEVLVWQEAGWSIKAVHVGEQTVRAEPFDTVDLQLPFLWGEGPAPR